MFAFDTCSLFLNVPYERATASNNGKAEAIEEECSTIRVTVINFMLLSFCVAGAKLRDRVTVEVPMDRKLLRF